MKKIYGVYGLVEWHVNIPAGRMLIPVEFTGGKFSSYGVTPAEYATADPVVQRAVERSRHFASGRIALLRTVGTVPAPESPRPVAEAASASRTVDVPDLNSARQQIMRLTGAGAAELRSRADMERVAREHGITLVISRD